MIYIQVDRSWLNLTDNTTGESLEILQHNCTTNLTEFPQLQLGVQCQGVYDCGSVRVCREGQSTLPTLPYILLHLLIDQEVLYLCRILTGHKSRNGN